MTVSLIELEGRISALEVVLVSHILQSNVADPDFDPRAFAAGRRDAWAAIGAATCQGASDGEEKDFADAYAAAMERLGYLLVTLAEPVQEAIDEVRNSLSSGAATAGRTEPAAGG